MYSQHTQERESAQGFPYSKDLDNNWFPFLAPYENIMFYKKRRLFSETQYLFFLFFTITLQPHNSSPPLLPSERTHRNPPLKSTHKIKIQLPWKISERRYHSQTTKNGLHRNANGDAPSYDSVKTRWHQHSQERLFSLQALAGNSHWGNPSTLMRHRTEYPPLSFGAVAWTPTVTPWQGGG